MPLPRWMHRPGDSFDQMAGSTRSRPLPMPRGGRHVCDAGPSVNRDASAIGSLGRAPALTGAGPTHRRANADMAKLPGTLCNIAKPGDLDPGQGFYEVHIPQSKHAAMSERRFGDQTGVRVRMIRLYRRANDPRHGRMPCSVMITVPYVIRRTDAFVR